jgi:hypothetical protein
MGREKTKYIKKKSHYRPEEALRFPDFKTIGT